MRRPFWLSGVAGIVMALSASSASADIRVFNEAVRIGNYKAAATEAAATWPTVDRTAPDAAATAREFAWIAMLAGQPESALVYAKFLVEQGAALTSPDPSPAVSRVLYDWAAVAMTPSPQTRARLFASLQQRATAVGRDLISVRAAQVLHAQAWDAGDWALADASAAFGVRFADELGASASPARFELRRGRLAAVFMRDKTPEAYNAMYDVAVELYDAIATTDNPMLRRRFATEYYATTAWGDAMYSTLGGRQRSTPNRANAIGVGKKSMLELLYPAAGDPALPRCRITLAKNFSKPGFPFSSRFKDFGGVVTYALDISPGGLFLNPRLLGVAPHDGLAEEVEDVILSWRWRIEGDVSPPSCRMPQTHILTFEFALGR